MGFSAKDTLFQGAERSPDQGALENRQTQEKTILQTLPPSAFSRASSLAEGLPGGSAEGKAMYSVAQPSKKPCTPRSQGIGGVRAGAEFWP